MHACRSTLEDPTARPGDEEGGPSPSPEPVRVGADALQGWKARGCIATVENGIVTVTPTGTSPFLGVGAGRNRGPLTFSVRVRSVAGGTSKIEWVAAGAASDKSGGGLVQVVLAAGDWQELKVPLPATGPVSSFRLHLPGQGPPVQIDWIELRSENGPPRRWNF